MRQNPIIMKIILLLIYLLGAVICIIASGSYIRQKGDFNLQDLLMWIMVTLSSFVGIIFLVLFHVIEIIAERCGNPVIWERKDNDE